MPSDVVMTPGNKAPGRYRKTTLSVALVTLISAGASAPTLYNQFLGEKEGTRFVAYQDGVGIWTICKGLTRINGQPVYKGMRLRSDECDKYDAEVQGKSLARLDTLVHVPLSEPAKAGIASFCLHNIGEGKCKDSTFLRLLNSGPAYRNDACAQITLWIHDQGKDCRKAGSGCTGQPGRRMSEDELCLIRSGEPGFEDAQSAQ